MNPEEMRVQLAVRTALLNQLNNCGMHPLPNTEAQLLQWFSDKNVTCSAPAGYLVLTQSDGSACVPSSCCETLRKARPELFAADAKRDAISSKQDFERGTPVEINRAKAAFVREHGLDAFENLPRTKQEAEKKSAPVSIDMTRAEYLGLSFSEKARLAGVIGADGIAKIMARRG